MTPTLLAADMPQPVAAGWQLILAAVAGIALIVVLITVVKLHPFLALIFGSLTVGSVAGENPEKVLKSFADGFGSTAASVGILIALGAMFAKLLADSGGADEIVDTIVGHASPRLLPWAMALVGAIIGLPMFFEIGLVLLMPVIYLVARRSQQSLITVGIPALAGLSAMHGLVPPHPGPLVAISNLHADLGITLALGVVVAIPTVIVAGPLFGRLAGRWVVLEAPDTFSTGGSGAAGEIRSDTTEQGWRRPSFRITLSSVLLPVVLMLGKAIVDILIKDEAFTEVAVFGMDEADVRLALQQPWVSVDNDSSGTSPEGPLAQEHPHPRAYGTFPRILRKYVRDEKALTLPDAIRKFTALPAQRMGFTDRGVLKRGMWADVVVFDPQTIHDTATYENPNQLAKGVDYVLVNGVPVIDTGKMTGALPGQVLRGPGCVP